MKVQLSMAVSLCKSKNYKTDMKTFKYLAAAALTMLAVGCNKEQVTEVPDGQMVDVTFTAALPGEMATKALGDGQTAKNLYVSVYENDTEKTHLEDLDKTATFTDLKTQVTFSLVKGKTYNFVFWAQAEDATCYDIDDLKNIKISYEGAVANDEKRDAFYATRKELKVNGALTETIKLYRPFAQVNFATADYAEAQKAGFNPAVSSFTASEAATTFDTFAEEGKDKVEVALTETEIPADVLKTLDGETYTRLAMNYLIPVGKQGESHNIDVAATFKANNGEAVTVSAPNAPVQNNYRTNILGNLLTSQVIFNVEIVPIFNEPDNDIDIVNVKDEASLRALFATGGEAKLAADVDITVSKSISLGEGKEVTLDLNGHKISNSVDLWKDSEPSQVCVVSVDGGTLTIKGKGGVAAKANDCYTFNVRKGGKLVIEDGEYVGNVSVIQVQEGLAEVSGGKFSLIQTWPGVGPDGCDYMINMIDAAYKAGIAKAVVTGGEFVKFNPADCAAEGAHTNFLADGYKSTQIGDSYFVTKAGVTPVANDAGLRDALNSSEGTVATINLVSGEFNWPDNKSDSGQKWPKTINVVGTNPEVCSVKLNAGSYPEDCDVLFENITIDNAVGCKYEEAALAQMVRVKNVTVKNCVIKNQFRILAKDVVNISDCKFVNRNASGFDGYCLNYYGYSGSRVNVENCVFDATQKAIVMYAESPAKYNLNVENCKFSASDRTTDKAAIQMHTEHGISGTVTIKDCVVEGFKANALSPEGLWWEGFNNVSSKPATKKFNITINGVNVQTAE